MTLRGHAVGADWEALEAELEVWRREGSSPAFWMRDDDACAVTAPLERLRSLAAGHGVQVGLAVIPGKLDDRLVDYLAEHRGTFRAMCHGWIHANYGDLRNPSEFGPHRTIAEIRADLNSAFREFTTRFGAERAVFVPPFARIWRRALPLVRDAGFVGVSVGETPTERWLARIAAQVRLLPNIPLSSRGPLPHLEVQIDPIDWRGKGPRTPRRLSQEVVGHLRLRRFEIVNKTSPIGLLTHHLDHKDSVWAICDQLLATLSGSGVAKFLGADEAIAASLGQTGRAACDAPSS